MKIYRGDQITAASFIGGLFSDTPSVSLKSLSQASDTLLVELPPDRYLNHNEFYPVIITFYVKDALTGTPKQVLNAVCNTYNIPLGNTDLVKYVEGKNTWLIGRGAVFLNNELVMVSIPTTPKTLVVGSDLMGINSKMAKYLKEKLITGTNYNHYTVSVRDTSEWVRKQQQLYEPVSMDKVNRVLLAHLTVPDPLPF